MCLVATTTVELSVCISMQGQCTEKSCEARRLNNPAGVIQRRREECGSFFPQRARELDRVYSEEGGSVPERPALDCALMTGPAALIAAKFVTDGSAFRVGRRTDSSDNGGGAVRSGTGGRGRSGGVLDGGALLAKECRCALCDAWLASPARS